MGKNLIDYFLKVKLEFSKIVWLSSKELKQLVLVVFIATVLSACFFAVIDIVVSSIIMKAIFVI